MADQDSREIAAFRAHMELCMRAVLAPMGRPDIRVTIIVRAPEALPAEAMISTNENLAVVRDALIHAAGGSDAG